MAFVSPVSQAGEGKEMKKQGTVKWFSRIRGYGFISPDDGGKEVFVHYSAIKGDGYRNPEEGDKVTFTSVDNGKGPQARDVAPLPHSAFVV